ncbi:Decaprenyl-phosphate phosphoribosyltransferase [Thalassovita gelatinovora]|uniref:Decaprenyl-phosphate phosphoribosyltransferase n=1 Tax=Thalassovita gelatinovora TaxID=53501 RepID=A0A0P1F849_THAGE|nr:UbiA family prenyltransferase [Thalassovita gelatinovora]QIZ80269.1 UbiA family prenyltransferase [Thalassovita gelatinovora]CUH64145.1 Decaprenyl-phosphate phosphoribosyltransferase [Thalassovita gelatinovora]SEQ84361.1 UbiA prenyltransferase family protein [Thalassovita gelatinovora]
MEMTPASPHPQKVPLIVHLEGALLRTDLGYESFWAALGHDVPGTLRHLAAGGGVRSLAGIAAPAADYLPLHEDIVDHARAAVAEGREVHLVASADQALVDAVAARLALPGPHFGTEPDRDLNGAALAAFLSSRFGTGGFDYIGGPDEGPEIPDQARQQQPVDVVEDGWTWAALLRELRPHQWIKNILLFVPLLAAHRFEAMPFAQATLAFAGFSLGASAIYILNDLLDLDGDRHHPEKRNRPIASGALPIPVATRASAALVLISLSLALLVSPAVAALTALYMTGSLSYSLWLKKWRWLDVITLACLFLLRLLTGAVAVQVAVPLPLLASAFAVFFVLACVKRITALSRLHIDGHLPRRGYRPSDLRWLEWASYVVIPVSAGLFLSYVFGPEAALLYNYQSLLAVVAVPMVVWLFRVVRLSLHGLEDFDPLRFVLHDRIGMSIILAALILVMLSA